MLIEKRTCQEREIGVLRSSKARMGSGERDGGVAGERETGGVAGE